MNKPLIRPIKKEDNAQVAAIVRSVIIEMGVPKEGTAYADKNLERMFEHYQSDRAAYFVMVQDHKVIGCAGIGQLDNYEGNVCELQKMYFLPEARGIGMGSKMMSTCLEAARSFGYEQCYLETMPYMTAAQKLYTRTGFYYVDQPLGNTGHYSCPVHMLFDL